LRVVGYVREAPGLRDGDTAYAQTEQIRRWTSELGHVLVAVCRDTRTPGTPLSRYGYRALLGIVRSGDADAVVLQDLSILSPDKVFQEVMIDDLTNAGATIIPLDDADTEALQHAASDHTRLIVRDVLAKVRAYRTDFGLDDDDFSFADESVGADEQRSDVIVRLIPSQNRDQADESADQAARPTA
jgi:DNA invertase Pin-like site-specific DNA recombinase